MLTFNLKKEWFEKIKSGEKTHEYRKATPYWVKRLAKFMYFFAPGATKEEVIQTAVMQKVYFTLLAEGEVCFTSGYPKVGDKNRTLYANLKKISHLESGYLTDLKCYGPVFDIEFELIKDCE